MQVEQKPNSSERARALYVLTCDCNDKNYDLIRSFAQLFYVTFLFTRLHIRNKIITPYPPN